MITFNTPKDLGITYGNMLRQSILAQSECARIVAYSLGKQTIISSGEIDLIRFSSDLANLNIKFDPVVDYPITCEITAKDKLTVGDLRAKGIDVEDRSDDEVLLDLVGAEKTITLVILNVIGYDSSQSIKNRLSSLGQKFEDLNVIWARSADLKVSFEVRSMLNGDEVTFSIDSADEKRILKECVNNISNQLSVISSKLL